MKFISTQNVFHESQGEVNTFQTHFTNLVTAACLYTFYIRNINSLFLSSNRIFSFASVLQNSCSCTISKLATKIQSFQEPSYHSQCYHSPVALTQAFNYYYFSLATHDNNQKFHSVCYALPYLSQKNFLSSYLHFYTQSQIFILKKILSNITKGKKIRKSFSINTYLTYLVNVEICDCVK